MEPLYITDNINIAAVIHTALPNALKDTIASEGGRVSFRFRDSEKLQKLLDAYTLGDLKQVSRNLLDNREALWEFIKRR